MSSNSASLERALQKVFSVVVVLVLAIAIAIVFLILIHAIVNSSARAEATETPAAEGAELGKPALELQRAKEPLTRHAPLMRFPCPPMPPERAHR